MIKRLNPIITKLSFGFTNYRCRINNSLALPFGSNNNNINHHHGLLGFKFNLPRNDFILNLGKYVNVNNFGTTTSTKKSRRPKVIDTYPANSTNPEVAAIQNEIFGSINSYDQIASGRKFGKITGRGDAFVRWYGPSDAALRRQHQGMLKAEINKMRTDNKPEEEVRMLEEYFEEMKLMPDQIAAKEKLEKLKKRGKAPPKKGFGKRAARKK